MTAREPRASTVHLRDYLRILYKHRWPASTVLTLVIGLSVLYNVTRRPMYEARVRLLIDAGTQNIVNFKQAVEQDKQVYGYYQTQILLLESRALARQTLEALNLWQEPEFVGGGAPPGRLETIANAIFSPVATARGALGSAHPAAPSSTVRKADGESAVIDAFLSRLHVAPVGESRLVAATFTASDPVVAAQAVNGLAEQYIQQNRDATYQASQQALEWLRGKLAEQREQVERSELAAQTYREHNDPVTTEDKQNVVMQRLADLSAAVSRVKIDRIAKEAQYRQLERLRGKTELAHAQAVMADPVVQELHKSLSNLRAEKAQLGERLGEKHPQIVQVTAGIDTMQARLDAEIDKVVDTMRSELERATSEEASLSAALDAQKKEMLSLNRRSIGFGALARDASSNREIFDSLIQRLKEADIADGFRTSDIRIIDRAEVPRAPQSRTFGRLFMSFLFGVLASMGLAFFLEHIDSSVKSPEEVRDYLRLPLLGMLPIFRADRQNGLPVVSRAHPGHFLEAFQTVRTNILLSSATGGGPRTLMVTSTQSNEGKSVVAANLAVSLAQIGMRVLLVDGDIRRPSLHTAFNEERGPGLAELLAGTIAARSAVRETREPNVFLLPAGTTASNPATLLESSRFRDLIKAFGADYDWVIVDGPPVMPVTDASIVASIVSGVLFVVGSEMTSRYAAINALNQLEHARAGFVGAVLNRVKVTKHAYYYSDYYQKKYGSYYEAAS